MKIKKYDSKIFRLVSILNKLNGGGKVRSSELAEEFSVSIRSVQRDLDLLNLTGFPLNAAERGVYSFMPGFSLKKAALTGEQASLLAFLNEIASEFGPGFQESFREILAKVLYREAEPIYYAKFPSGRGLDRKSREVTLLEKAIYNEQRALFVYTVNGKEKMHKVDPLKIAFYDGFWYLICRDSEHGWILKLRVEKIKSVEVLNETYEVPANLKAMLDHSVNAWFTGGNKIRVVLKIDAGAASYFRNREYVPMQKVIKTFREGSILVESRAGQFMEVTPVILRWLPHVRVISPHSLKAEVRSLVKRYLNG